MVRVLALALVMLHLCRSFRVGRSNLGSRMSLLMSTTTSSSVAGVSTTSPTVDKLARIRELMAQENVDAFIVPTDDPHLSEYTAPHYARREFLSGFTGSAGTAVVMKDKALLFTDGRYHNQAELELQGSTWTLMKQGLKDVPNFPEFLANSLPEGAVVGYDPLLHAVTPLKRMQEILAKKKLHLKPLEKNLVDPVWELQRNRPPAPQGQLRLHDLEHAGKSVPNKLEDIRRQLKSVGAIALVLTTLDDVAWTFNVRGSDVPCNPVSVAYGIVTLEGAELFINAVKVSPEVAVKLREAGVSLRPYEEALAAVRALDDKASKSGSFIWLDGKSSNMGVYSAVHSSRCIDKESPVTLMKACKNDAELAGMRACHLRDGAAVAEFFAWLEEELKTPGRTVSEVEVDERVTASRASFGRWLEPSFPTIAGVNSNGAIVHYRAVPETCKQLGSNDMMLLDSGGQYLDGTTDVTRTFHTGQPSSYQMEMFTRVLKGHIALDSRIFPTGTAGCFLDSFAREHLWAIGKDYIHGTGHGVGAALNVHEGPHRISRVLDGHALMPGMVVSNEPGYYEDGKFGIRIENLLVVVNKTHIPEFAGRPFLGFERLTHIPIQKKLMEMSLLTPTEIQWINTYHKQIHDRVFPLLKTDRAREWMIRATAPIA